MFADDVKLYVQIVNCVDMERLQRALSALSEWAEEWQLALSVDKCCVLNIGIENCPPHLVLDKYVLPVVPHTRDLGTIVSRHLGSWTIRRMTFHRRTIDRALSSLTSFLKLLLTLLEVKKIEHMPEK